MDLLSSDIIVNVILPRLPAKASENIPLKHASKRYHRLIGNIFSNNSQNNLEILREICEGGFVSLLSCSHIKWTRRDARERAFSERRDALWSWTSASYPHVRMEMECPCFSGCKTTPQIYPASCCLQW